MAAFYGDRVGQQLGNYLLIRLLEEGGFAQVYLGEHVHLKSPAAIKVLYTRLAKGEVEGFRTEARNIARLEHPHIVRVLEFDVENNIPFLAMYYAPNGNLRQCHPRGVPLPLPTIVSYANQVADALQHAHDKQLIHRDIKPENMLVGRRNEILLSDFGVALLVQSLRLQSTQAIVGTAAYMAPEQVKGKPCPPSDQYSLAVVIYEWVSGSRPFEGSFSEIASQHLLVPPPPLHEKVPTISQAVENVVLKALAKEPLERFESVRDFAKAFEKASKAPPRRASPVSSAQTSPSSQPVERDTQSSQFSDPTNTAVSSGRSESLKRGISRREVLIGLGGVVVGSSMTWLALSQNLLPWSPNMRYVTNLYHDILGRPATSGEINRWIKSLDQGFSRAQVASSILSSTEYRQNLVNADYQQLLHRAVDSSSRQSALNLLNNGVRNEDLLVGLAASDEYYSNRGGGTNSGFVNVLYLDLLKRLADSSGLAAWTQKLDSGSSRVDVARGFVASQEYYQDLVNSYYQHYLHRPADPTGESNTISILNHGGTDESAIESLVTSPEYYS